VNDSGRKKSAVEYSTVQYSTVQYSTLRYVTLRTCMVSKVRGYILRELDAAGEEVHDRRGGFVPDIADYRIHTGTFLMRQGHTELQDKGGKGQGVRVRERGKVCVCVR
jgi:hypothetical protein